MAARSSLGRLRRPWWILSGLLAFLLAVAAVAPVRASTVPAVLPVVLVFAAGTGGVAVVLAIRRGLILHRPDDDDDALAEVRGRQAMSLSMALAPVVLGGALAVVLGHRATLFTAAAVGAAAVAAGLPRRRTFAEVDASWSARDVDASILRALGGEPPKSPSTSNSP
ncbi:MAG: hypothetical protein WDZ26_01725 [Nitriliruptoraceae bacterium]